MDPVIINQAPLHVLAGLAMIAVSAILCTLLMRATPQHLNRYRLWKVPGDITVLILATVLGGIGFAGTLTPLISDTRTIDHQAVFANIEETYLLEDVSYAEGSDSSYTPESILITAGPDSPTLYGVHDGDPVLFVVGFDGDTPTSISVTQSETTLTRDLTKD